MGCEGVNYVNVRLTNIDQLGQRCCIIKWSLITISSYTMGDGSTYNTYIEKNCR